MNSPLLTPNGKPAPMGTNWEPPEKTAYFGFMSPNGPVCIPLSVIAVVAPALNQQGVANGMYLIGLNVPGVPPMSCPPEDAFRLLRRLGWTERGITRPE